MYINYLDSGVSSDTSKYVDHMKTGKLIWSDSDGFDSQTDLDKINEWKEGWQMQFNINKCKVLIVVRGIPRNWYTINNETLIGSEYEKI